jgi:hypothetical protein
MSPHTLERTTLDANGVARAYGRMWRERLTLRAKSEGVHLLIINRQRCSPIADNIEDPCGLNDRKPLVRIDTYEDIARKKRELNLPSNPVFPTPYVGVDRQEGLDLFGCQLRLDELFVARSGVDRVPLLSRGIRMDGTCFDAKPGNASIRNRGDHQHNIPPCQKPSCAHSGTYSRKRMGS